jgi:hypothetical protein
MAQIGAMRALATMNPQATQAARRPTENVGGFSSWYATLMKVADSMSETSHTRSLAPRV